MTYDKIMSLLKERRVEQGLTQTQLGDLLDLKSPSASISLRESCKANVSARDLVEHAKQLDMEVMVLPADDAALVEAIMASPKAKEHLRGLLAALGVIEK
jgi:transcriptional regulator with XRE-family HTH domain